MLSVILQKLKNIVMQEIDTSNGVIFPFYDQDTNVVYLCGKVCVFVCLFFIVFVGILVCLSVFTLLHCITTFTATILAPGAVFFLLKYAQHLCRPTW